MEGDKMKIVNCSNGELIRETSEQEEQVYNALYKWADRLNKWEYAKQVRNNKGKKLKTFSPNDFSLQLIDNMKLMINEKITPAEAMSILHTAQGRAETRMCMEAGF